jgi:hypothetical protein
VAPPDIHPACDLSVDRRPRAPRSTSPPPRPRLLLLPPAARTLRAFCLRTERSAAATPRAPACEESAGRPPGRTRAGRARDRARYSASLLLPPRRRHRSADGVKRGPAAGPEELCLQRSRCRVARVRSTPAAVGKLYITPAMLLQMRVIKARLLFQTHVPKKRLYKFNRRSFRTHVCV